MLVAALIALRDQLRVQEKHETGETAGQIREERRRKASAFTERRKKDRWKVDGGMDGWMEEDEMEDSKKVRGWSCSSA